MSETRRLGDRNAAIAEMLSNGKGLKDFYRFTAQNPHMDLHDACQIVIARPSASVCFSFEEWNAMERRVTKGRKGIPYYDRDGNKLFVFDANDTHGEKRYQRLILPMKRLLEGLDTLNDTNLAEGSRGDYRKIHTGVGEYLKENGNLTGDYERNRLLIEGITYSLYSKTGFPSGSGVELHGLPYSFTENAELFKEIYTLSENIALEAEEAYFRKQAEVKVIDDTEEETVSDEVKLPVTDRTAEEHSAEPVTLPAPEKTEQTVETIDTEERKNIVEIHSAVHSHYKGYVALVRYKNPQIVNGGEEIYLGRRENYDGHGHYDNTDNSLVFISENPKMYYFLYGDGWTLSQEEMIEGGYFSLDDYKEYAALKAGILNDLERVGEPKFGIDLEIKGSGVPFVAPVESAKTQEISEIPEEEQETSAVQTTNALSPLYERYSDAQSQYPNAVVLLRLGDFYEVMGENAVTVAGELDLTLTGRDVGLAERVPMCGFPYHATEKYIEKILEKHSVVVVEDGEQPKYILAHSEAIEQSSEFTEQETDEEAADFPDEEQDGFDEFEEVFDEDDYEEAIEADEDAREEKQPQEKPKGKPISQRKKKERPQPSLFDIIEGKDSYEQTPEEKLIEWGLKYGSNIADGKFRIYDKYKSDPTVKEFAKFLKDEYGWGGSYSSGQEFQSDGKGLAFAWRDKEHPENDVAVALNWTQAANGIADLIDDGNYFTQEQSNEYARILRYRAERNNAATDGERCEVIARQIVEYGTANTYSEKFSGYPHFLEDYTEFLKEHRQEISERLLGYEQVISVGIPEFPSERDVNVSFKLEYCPKWQKVLEREQRDTERLQAYANAWIEGCADTYNEENIEDGKIRWTIERDAFEERDFLFLKDNRDELIEYLESVSGVESADFSMQRIEIIFDREFIERIAAGAPIEVKSPEQGENTDLTEVGFNQAELGGAKQRYRNNLEAIRLLNQLYDEDRNPTAEEKKVLAKYVGWGGIAQVFDEKNPQWQKEYHELKTALSSADYERAKGSVLNAHYTSKEVIEGVYNALARFGVKGNNRILEPAMGTGNFFGYMPKELSDGASLHGVELDNITGRIAAKLYPQVKVQVKGYEETTFPNNHFDLVVTNVPFGGYGVADSEYNRHKFLIHDYFIAKSLDKVRAGGIVAVITSKGTMDKLNPSVRKYLAERAELLGAIRLPNTAFKQTANTEVVTDILFFQKREDQINADTENTEWLKTGKTEDGFEINNYFIRHPEMVLGSLAEEHGLYGAIDVTVKPDGRELAEALSEAIYNLPESVYSNPTSPQTEQEEAAVDYDVRPLNYKAENGRLYMRIGERMVEQDIPKFPKDAYARISGMIALRSQLRNILDMQTEGCSDERLADEQRILGANYDRFVRKYGYLNSQTNTRLFREDGDSALLLACEELSEDKTTATKADVFTKRTIRPYATPTSTDDCFEALQISKNERGGVDISYIEELTKKDYDVVLSELGDAVFRNPVEVDPEDKYSGFETAEEYLSGKVVQKLNTAKNFALQYPDKGYDKNVLALEKVQPEPLTAADISVRLGASWVDKEYYKEFLRHILDIPFYYRDGLELYYNPHDSSWRVDKANYVRNSAGMRAREVFGTERANAFRLFEDCLNLRATNIYDTVEEDGKEKRVLNQAETIAAREKQNKIKEAFKDWIFDSPARREELEETYNRLFNQIRLPSYDGSYLKFPEMNPAIELRPHQKNAIHRIITSGNTLLHHVVGSGKTYTIAATVMKLRQYGLSKKPMIAVPNHLVEQWAGEFRTLYPNAKLLIATKEDLTKENRQRFVSKVAMGDWDAVIIAQSSFAKIPISPERQIDKISEEIAKIDATIDKQWEESGFPRGAVKNLERIKKNKETQLKRLLDDKNKDNLLNFESLGVDYLFVDEAHFYKNKFLFTKMNNVAGISTTASQRAADLELKVEYINELHDGDKGVVFATGTPISNSMTEMYTMQSYLQKRTLEEIGLNYFDGWAADFGETVTSLELAPSGQGYKPRTRFAKFTNLPELQTLYRSFADVQTADMVKLAVPEAERTVVNLKPSDTVIDLAEEIAERAERIYGGGVDPHIDNMLKVTSDGKKLALDARCFDNAVGDEPNSKLNACAGRIFEIWEDTKDKQSAQIVFCDMSTPKKAFAEYEYGKDFDVYNDLKHKLTERGIPAHEIAFIHDASTDQQKQDLFKRVNTGQVRVLIGSTEKCGAGTNAQQRLIALHHLDTPYRPSDMEQREGRIIRQGNTNEKVQIYTYVTERTFDSYSYQILENKQRFISQICKGDLTAREADDVDETTLSYAEIKAITAANPRIKRKMEVDSEVEKLRVLEGQHKKSLYSLQDRVNKTLPEQIRKQTLFIERLKEDTVRLREHFNPEAFSVNVNGVTYTDKKDGARALTDALYASRPDTVVAEYGGFKISMNPLVMLTTERTVTVAGSGQYTLEIGQNASGNVTRLDNFFADFQSKETRANIKLEQLKNDLETAKSQLGVPFEYKERLMDLLKEQSELNAELDLNRREEVVIDDGESAEESYTALPERRAEHSAIRKKNRKPLNKYSMSVYDKQKIETPEAYIFVKNGSRYELFGEQAERYAEEHELPVITDTLDGAQTLVLSLADRELDKAVAKLVENGKTVKIIETLENKKEDELIDKIDKVAAMEVAILPDHTVTQEDLHDFGYTWDGMLPLRSRAAKRLWGMGLQVYALRPDDTETEITDFEQFGADGIYGIEKPVWNNYLGSKESDAYFAARMIIANAAGKVINDELDYVDASYADPLSDLNFEERAALTRYMRGKEMPDAEKLKPYLHELLTEYSDYISHMPLEHYGWTEDDVSRAIANHIVPETLKEYAKEITAREPLAEYYGRDTENTGYYYFKEKLSLDTLPAIQEKADDYVIAAPVCYLSEEERANKHIFFLKIGRDITEEELSDSREAITNMQKAVYRITKARHDEYREEMRINVDCKRDIEKAVSANFDGMHLSGGFENELIDKYGLERIEYVLANSLQYKYDDGRFSRENKEWANGIVMTQSEDHRNQFVVETHPAVLDGFVSRIRKQKQAGNEEAQTAQQDKYLNGTHQGYKILQTTKDKLGRNIVVVQRPNDYAVGAGYDIRDGRWAQGYYNFPTLEAAEEFRKENYAMSNEQKPKRKWLTVNVAKEAAIERYANHTFLRMPTTGEYAGYTYNMFNNRIKESSQITDALSDSREPCYQLVVAEDETVTLSKRNGDEVELTAEEFKSAAGGTTAKDYAPKKRVTVSLPREAMRKMYENSTLFVLPNTVEERGFSYFIPNSFAREDTESEDGRIILSLPEDFTVKAQSRDGVGIIELTAQEFYDNCNGTTAEQYVFERGEYQENASDADNENNGWRYVSVDKAAKIAEYENRTLLKMPQGEYGGYVYYIPNKLLKENGEKGTIRVGLPEDFVVNLHDKSNDKEVNLTVEDYIAMVKDKNAEDYTQLRKPSDGSVIRFSETEARLKANVPEEMKARPNWVAVRTQKTEDRLRKYLIDCHTGKFAESDNPETWTDFDSACRYAKENGCETLAYALDGKDGICCLDLDHCIEENGDMTPIAHAVKDYGGSYSERSVSGRGLHFFGKTKGLDVRTFSKDGDLEFYQKSHFIAMTGDMLGGNKLINIDGTRIQELVEAKCEKRKEWKGAGAGVEGLSSMSDRDVVEKACAAKHGDTFKALYDGQDLQNNHSNSDMSLMNRLAFWCNGDKEQMLRIFATSGLYRPEKSPSYYEGTAIKAVRDTTSRFQPQERSAPKPSAVKQPEGSGKR